jgi:hypothetical protein
MNPIEFSQRLVQAEPGSPESAALARELVEDARYPAHFVLQHYLSSAEIPLQMKAKSVLADLRELSLVPLAEIAPMHEVQISLWVIRTMAEELVVFRSRAVSVLKSLLTNRRPAREGSSPYQIPRGTRVCDLAFILLHRIFHLESSPSAFFGLPRDARDKRIKEFQESRAFRSMGSP